MSDLLFGQYVFIFISKIEMNQKSEIRRDLCGPNLPPNFVPESDQNFFKQTFLVRVRLSTRDITIVITADRVGKGDCSFLS